MDTICKGEWEVRHTGTASAVGNEAGDAAAASWNVVVGEGDGSVGGSGAVVLALT